MNFYTTTHKYFDMMRPVCRQPEIIHLIIKGERKYSSFIVKNKKGEKEENRKIWLGKA